MALWCQAHTKGLLMLTDTRTWMGGGWAAYLGEALQAAWRCRATGQQWETLMLDSHASAFDGL